MAVDKKISELASGAPAQAGDEYVVARSGANYKLTLTNIAASMPPIGATTPNTGAFTTLSASSGETISGGNLTFSSTAQRITGDFSNATVANRLLFQTSTANNGTFINTIGNGTVADTTSSGFVAFADSNTTDSQNAGVIVFKNLEARISTGRAGSTASYLPMTFYTGGSERVRIDTSGNVGIGTTSPGAKFAVNGGTGTSQTRFEVSTTQVQEVSTNAAVNAYADRLYDAAQHVWKLSSSQAMVLNSSGNVGIGTASPNKSSSSTALTVNTGTAGNFSAIEWASGDTLNYHINANNSAIYHVAAGTRPWIVYTNGSERMRIDSSGNVGIGTASPGAKLEVSSSGTAGRILLNAVDLPMITNGFDKFTSGAYNGAGRWGMFMEPSQLTFGCPSTGSFNFKTFNADSTSSTRVTIDGSGNVLVNRATTVGNAKFALNGSSTSALDYSIWIGDSGGTRLFGIDNAGGFSTGTAGSSPYNNTTANAANVVVDANGVLQRSTSSLRYKSDVTTATHGLADVLKLRSVTYKGKNDGDKVFGGLIAEEVHDAGLTEFVAYDKEGRPDAIHYGNMVALLVKAVQELTARVAELEAK